MRIVPDSQVVFYSGVDIIPGEQHLAFKQASDRDSYFANKVAATYTNVSMVRKDGTLLIDASVISPSVMFTCNYLSFVNPSWGNKRFFGFIVDVDYMTNETMIVKWTLDEFESWRFEAQYEPMTIERQHISQADSQKNPYDPSILEHRTVESLPIGPDLEPYYSVGSTQYDDGVFLGERLCQEQGVSNTLGILLVFSDIDLASKDSAVTSGTKPSAILKSLMNMSALFSSAPTSFSVMSPALYAYLLTQSSPPSNRYSFDSGVWGSMYPLQNSDILPPVSYVYVDGAATPGTGLNAGAGRIASLLNWFTNNGLEDAIIGMYPLPAGMALFSGNKSGNSFYVGKYTKASMNVRNKKLALYPFSYFRLISPNGDIKELKIEDFHDAQLNPNNVCKIAVAFDATDNPSLTAAPINYKFNGGISPHVSYGANLLESLCFSQFPTLPYTISAWESQRAAIANSIIANNTTEYGYQQALEQVGVYNDYASAFGGFFDGLNTFTTGSTSPVGMLLEAGASIVKLAKGMFQGSAGDMKQNILENRWAQSEEAYDVALGKQDTAIDKNFKYARPAYACNKYYRSNGVGFSNFMDMAFCDILFLTVSLKPEILAKYDAYFDRYGYASGEIGTPHVISYMQGSTNPAETPYWRPDSTTYVKTANCTVKNVPMPVANAIAQMFNAGIRFYAPAQTIS